MKLKRKAFYLIAVLAVLSMVVGVALADDSIMFRHNISKLPEGETEKAGLVFMNFNVPAQKSDGTLLDGIDYVWDDGSDLGAVVTTTLTAKPLIATYIDEEPEETIDMAGILGMDAVTSGLSIGRHDGYIAHSLDDGATWKSANVSMSADQSSFTLENGIEYPGDVYAMVHQVAGNRVIAAWLSRYCDGGTPLYTLAADEIGEPDTVYLDYMQTNYLLPDLYVTDIWGVSGTQKSVNYVEQGFPDVGEIPFGCVWTARGVLVDTTNETTNETTHDIVWTKPERLTSGVRDPNRLEVDFIKGAGAAITWQEDPEGLRPGQGLGPGEGWSGAIVNAKTDIWYSYISWDHFNLVDVDGDLATYSLLDTVDLEQFVDDSLEDATMPKVAVPMAMPVRLTDNNMCKFADGETKADDYCHADVDVVTGEIVLDPIDEPFLCTADYAWDTPDENPDTTVIVCEAADGRILNGRVGASRPRISMQPYDKDGDGVTDSAWFIMGYEETKALGENIDEEGDPIEIGKNIWYHTFEFNKPEVVKQGGMLNQPSAFNPEDPSMVPAEGDEFLSLVDEFGYKVYFTEIARRFSFMAQPIKALLQDDQVTYSGTTAFLLYKEGTLNQGGPADIFARYVQLPETFDPLVDNPYAFENMACDDWYTPEELGYNPNYQQGFCGVPAINLSGTTNDVCYLEASADEPSQDCVDVFPWDGDVEVEFPKVNKWLQFEDNLDDQSWENPFDVSKGHRGFLDGDFVMIMYAWSANWKANSVGNDHYNLYVRRSFDGGLTWTTTPAELGGAGVIGTEPTNPVCDIWGKGDTAEQVCYDYAAGQFEMARNVSLLDGVKVTILDPRYTPTGGLKKWVIQPYVDDYLDTTAYAIEDWDLTRDPSTFFMIYETGDNTTAAEGEPTPLDLFYSRATVYGDFWEWEEVPTSDGGTEYRWPWAEKDREDLSGEAAMTANPSGNIMYADWNQWREEELEDGEVHVFDSDVWFRRFFYNDITDAQPTASLLYTSPQLVDYEATIVLLASARDFDQLGEGEQIVEYEWLVDGAPWAGTEGDFETDCYQTKQCNMPARNLSEGWHGFSVRGKDNEGNWSNPATYEVLVWETINQVFVPVIIR